MAMKINDSSKKVLKDFSTYKGVCPVKVYAGNPTLAELQELGMNFNSEPEYVSETDTGEAKVRIDFIVGNDKLKTKLTFFLEDRERVSKNGKFEFINNLGQSSWGETLEEVLSRTGRGGNTWFNELGARKALVGEAQLMQFLADWLNIDTNAGDEVYLENLPALFKGDFSELKKYVKEADSNRVYVLLTVNEKDGKFYQNVYNGAFARASFTPQAAIGRFAKEAKKQEDSGYPIKGFAGLEFGEYIPTLDSTEPDADAPTSVENVDDLF